ncbi:VCBS domain-containing protein [Niveibacterium microcysteis]|uniref:VCBS domain-containing protein n=1 Tax=Niveibacterium microcysteis TaxID=2811415 RepID=A0ABX7MCB5_9RHOO|nr:VCBS domain-containing protein [Niveibacterium microcysteis]QSI78358.1 VCBS domain-containing protein [Niveibacterium microcysteis]
MATTTNHAEGTVARLEGKAWVREADGSLRPIHLGDRIAEGQVVVTDNGAVIELRGPHGDPVTLGGGREVLADAGLLTQDAVPAQDAALTPPDAELERVIASLNAGADPLAELDPTAAGLGGGSGGDGHGFVRLLRISEGVDPLSFQTSGPIATDTVEQQTLSAITTDANAAPEAAPLSVTLPEDTSTGIRLDGVLSDPNGDPITLVGTPTASVGTVTVNTDGTLTYTPPPNYNGPATIIYTVSDGRGATTDGTITVNVTPVNDAPTATNVAVTTLEDTPVAGRTPGSDVDGDTLSYAKGSDPTHGSVTVNTDGTWVYTPTKDYNGPDSFTVTVSDGKGGTTTATVSVGVTPVNDAPVPGTTDGPAGTPVSDANIDPATGHYTLSTPEDTPISGQVKATDVDGDSLSFAKASDPAHGSVTVNTDGTWTYTPAKDFNGQDSFTVTVSDGKGGTALATVDIGVTQVNDPATILPGAAGGDAGAVKEDVRLTASGQLVVSDADAGQAVFQQQTAVAGTHGSFSIDAAGNWTYLLNNTDPAVQALGEGQSLPSEVFTVKSADGTTSTVTVAITGTNDGAQITPSVPGGDTGSVTEDAVLLASGKLQVSDVDTGEASFQAGTQTGTYGSLTIDAAGNWSYSLNNAAANVQSLKGTDTVTETIVVKSLDGTPHSIVITVHGQDETTASGNGTVQEDTTLTSTGTLTTSGVATFVPETAAGAYGDLVVAADGTWTYTLRNADSAVQALNGTDSKTETFTVALSDGSSTSITINVLGTNDAAQINPSVPGGDTGSVTEDAVLLASGKLQVSDVDTGEASFQAGTQTGTYGSLTIDAAGNWSYSLNNAAANVQSLKGTDTVTETIVVKSLDGTPHSIEITVHGQDETTASGNGTVQEDTTLTSTGTLTTSGVATFVPETAAGAYGDLVVAADGTWTYTLRNADSAVQALNGTDSKTETFTVALSDGSSTSITINVLGTNDAAQINPSVPGGDTGSVTEDAVLLASGKLQVSDVDTGEASFQAGTQTGTYGSLTIDAAGNWSYSLNNAAANVQSLKGTDTVTETIVVKSLDGTPHSIEITVHGQDETTASGNGTVQEDTTLTSTGTLTTSGVATFVPETAAGAYGDLVVAADGTWTYTLRNADSAVQALNGTDSKTETFTVALSDGSSTSITINVLGTNDAAQINPSVPGGDTGSVTEDAVLLASGKLQVSDVDTGEASFQAGTQTGTYGSLTIDAAGNWSYSLNNAAANVQSLKGTDTVTETIVVKSLDGTPHSIEITVHGQDETTASGNGTVQEDTTLTSTGTLTTSGVATFVPETAAGAYGDLVVAADGTWTYTLRNADSAVQALNGTDSKTETFTVALSDGSSTSITINVLGTNDAAQINPSVPGGDTGSVTEDAVLLASGKLQVSDVDTGEASFQAGTQTGTYGSLTIDAAGNWSYSLNNAAANVQSLKGTDTVTETIVVKSLDGTPHSIVITVHGQDETTASGNGTVREDTTLTSTGTLTTSGVATFVPETAAGAYGDLVVAADGTWTYTLRNADSAVQALNATDSKTETFTVALSDGSSTSITINVLGTNDIASIQGPGVGAVQEAGGIANAIPGTPNASGTLLAADADNGEAGFQAVAPAALNGTYGTFTFNAATGAWTYALDNAKAATQALTNGQIVHDTLTVTSLDGTATKAIDVTVTGANDTAAITGTATGTMTEDVAVTSGNLTASGNLAVTDVDSGEAVFATPATLAGTYGTFTFNTTTGAWTYAANNAQSAIQSLGAGQSLTDSITVKSADGTASQVISVTINGTNDGAVITPATPGADAGAVKEDVTLTASGQLVVTDVDAGQAVFQPQTAVAGAHGTFSIDAAGNWVYTLNNADPVVQALGEGQSLPNEVFTVKSADGTASTVTVSITGTNDGAQITPSVLGADTGAVKEDVTLTTGGQLQVSDVDAGQAVFQPQTAVAGAHGSFSIDASGNWTYTLNNANPAVQALGEGQSLPSEEFTVKSADGTTSTVTVAITGTNDGPVAAIDTNSLVKTDTTAASGNVLTNDSDIDTAHASLIVSAVGATPVSGTTVVVGNYGTLTIHADGSYTYVQDASNAAVIALKPTDAPLHDVFNYTLSDGSATSNATLDIAISGANTAPVAMPAHENVTEGGALFNGNVVATDAESDALSYSLISPAPAGLTFNTDGSYSFNPANPAYDHLAAGQTQDVVVTYQVADGKGGFDTDTLTITIVGTNDVPVIGGTTTGTVVEAGGVANAIAGTPNASGTVTVSDADAGQSSFQAVAPASLNGTYGTFTFNAATGAWTYALDNTKAATQALTNGQIVHDTLTVTSLDGTATKAIDVTVTGANDTAAITGTATGTMTEDVAVTSGNLTAAGALAVTDVDSGEAVFATPATLAGTYGTFTFNTTTGVWTYAANNSQAAIQSLGAGQSLTDSITVKSADGTASQVISVTINGANDGATIGGTATGTVVEAGGVANAIAGTPNASGTVSVSDADAGQSVFQAVAPASLNGTYGTFTFNAATGAWTYALDNTKAATQALTNGQVVHDTLTVTSLDGTATKAIDVTVTGANDTAAITGTATGTMTEDVAVTSGNLTASGNLAVTDVDSGEAVFATPATLAGTYGTFTFNTTTGAWTYAANNAQSAIQSLGAGQSLTDSITVKSADGTASQVISVTINGTNDGAVITPATPGADAGAVKEDVTLTASGQLVVTDVDAGQAVFQPQTAVAGAHGTFSIDAAGNWVYTLNNADPVVQALGEGQSLPNEVFTVKSADGTASTVTVSITGTNDGAQITPSVLGADTGAVKEDVTLTTGGQLQVSDVDAGQAVFQPQTAVAGAHGSFSIDASGNWTYTLNNANPAVQALGEGQSLPSEEFTVKSADGTTSTVTVAITGTNDGPVAAIDTNSLVKTDTTAASGNVLTNDSDIDTAHASLIVSAVGATPVSGTTVVVGNYGTLTIHADGSYTYVQDASNAAVIALKPTDAPLHDVFNYTLSDGSATSNATLDIAISGANTAPVAMPAHENVTEGGALFNGNVVATDAESDALSYSLISPAPAGLTFNTDGSYSFNPANPAYDHLAAGQTQDVVVTYQVADGKGGFDTDTLTITIVGTNDVPVIGGTTTGTVVEAGGVANAIAGTPNASGTVTVSDADAGQSSFQAVAPASLNGTYGTFTFNAATGAWTYALDNTKAATQALTNGQIVHDTLTVTSLDGTATKAIDVTVTGANDTAAITGTATGTMTEDVAVTSGNLTAAGALAVTDVDSGEAVFATPATLAGTYGTFTFNTTTGVWTYAANNSQAAIQSLGAGQSLTDSITVKSADGTASQVISVTINGANDGATIGGTATGTVVEAGGVANAIAGTPNASGTVSVSDADAGQSVFQAVAPASLNGTYGTFTFNAATGAWTYALDNTKAATQALTNGQVVHDTLTVTSLDGTATKAIDVTVTGANDTAAITGTATGTMTEDVAVTSGNLTASGNLAVTDVDSGEAVFATPATLAGTYGTFTFNTTTGVWTYAANNSQAAIQSLGAGQSLTDSITVKSADGTASQVISVTINGANDGATIGGTATGTVVEAGGVANAIAGTPNASGTVSVSDADAGQSVFQAVAPASLNGTYGTFTFNAATGAWTYALDNTKAATQALTNGQVVHDTLTVTSLDGTATKAIDVTVTGANDTAAITGTATGTMTEDVAVTSGNLTASGSLAVTDVDAGQAVFATPATLAGTYGTFTFNTTTGAWTYAANNAQSAIQSLGAGQSLTDSITVKSADGTASQVISVTINGTNDGATIGGTATGAVVEAGGVANAIAGTPNASGTVSVSDADAGQSVFQAVAPASLNGTYGTFTFNAATGAWTYALDNSKAATQALTNGQIVHDTLTVTSLDGTATKAIDVTVTGANDTAAITGTATGTMTEDVAVTSGNLTASGSLAVTDVDAGQAVFATPATLAGTYGTFTFNTTTGAWTYAANNAQSAIQSLGAGQSLTDSITVKSADGTASQVISVTINGTNDVAMIQGPATGSVTEAGGVNNATAGTPTTSGTLIVSDTDAGQSSFLAPASLAGTYGNFTFNTTTGAWTYTLDNTKATTQGLVGAQVVHDTLTVSSLDGSASKTIDVTVTGANDNAAITGSATGSVTEDAAVSGGNLIASGALTVTDVDAGQAVFQSPASLAGTYGTFTFNTSTGAWTYAANNAQSAIQSLGVGQTLTDSITVKSADGTASQVISVTINGANDAPVAAADTAAVKEDTTLTATGNVITTAPGRDTDVDGDPLTVTGVTSGTPATTPGGGVGTAIVGTYGTLTLNSDGTYNYALNNTSTAVQNLTAGQVANDVFTYTISDGHGGTATTTLTVAVTGTQDLTAGTPSVVSVNATGLNGEFFGYNETASPGSGYRTHSDDGTATFGNHLVAGNLNSVEDMYTIINGRNALAGGSNNLVGSSATATTNAADVAFKARSLDYGFNPTVNSALGSNSNVAAGSALPTGDGNASSTTRGLSNFLDQDQPTGIVQTGAGNTGGTSGLGLTTDAAIRLSGQMYVQHGSYDFRVTADDGFRLNVAGQTLLEYDGNQGPTTRIFTNVALGDLNGGLQAFELLYWEQGGNARLRIEYKASGDPASSYQVMALTNTALFTNESAPTLVDPRIQDLVYDAASGSWQLRTGSILDGDASNNTITGGTSRDWLTGGAGDDTLIGNGGADTLDGGAGNDILNGGIGNDLLTGGAGTNTLTGGTGDDTYRLTTGTDTLVENANEGTDTVILDSTYYAAHPTVTIYTLASNFENLTAEGSFAINLSGNSANNRIEGNSAANVISGGGGNDYIVGGGGNDTLTGGSGSDVFVWHLADAGPTGTPAVDKITDFTYGGGYNNIQSGTAGVPTGGGDVLDLRDLLQGEHTSSGNTGNAASAVEISNLLNYIDVEVTGSGATLATVLHISKSGGFTGGTFSAGAEDQTIVLQGVNLYTATSVTAGDESTLLKTLIKNGTLIVD